MTSQPSRARHAFIFCGLLLACVGDTPGLDIYVATNGSDHWSGSLAEPAPAKNDGPLATLDRAREIVRQRRRTEARPDERVTVTVRGGLYLLEKTFQLTKDDSGKPEAPILYRAWPGEVVQLLGGRVITGFVTVSDPDVLSRLDPAARGQVVQADLRARGVSEFGTAGGDGLELFFADKPMQLARWPNQGFTRIASILGKTPVDVRGTTGAVEGIFTFEGDRPQRWTNEKDIWMHGYWFWDWSDQRQKVAKLDITQQTIALEPPHHGYGYRKGQWYYAYNLLSEIDQPGEWYLDRQSGVLYFWPPEPLSAGQAIVSVLPTLVTMENTSYVTLQGFTFEGARATALTMNGGTSNCVVGCTIRNVGGSALTITGGAHHRVRGCDIYQCGAGGVSLSGGDRKTLEPAGHHADNNHIHHYGRWRPMYSAGLSLSGVGHRATHNLIDNAPHQAIAFSGNDHLIELNEIHHVCFESNDAGAIYAGRDWTMRGTVIRHNYLHDITGFEGRGCVGVYLDDMFCGTDIIGNIFYRVTRAAFIGGGRDCRIENNVFVECKPAIHVDARALGWAKYHADEWVKEGEEKGTLSGTEYLQPPYSVRYPGLTNILADEPRAPKGNLIARNICVGGRWDEIESKARPFLTLRDNLVDQDPSFVNGPNKDFRLRSESAAWKLGFREIPVQSIGLYQDPTRASWPVKSAHAEPQKASAALPAPSQRFMQQAGDLKAVFHVQADGITLSSLSDARMGEELLSPHPLPFFILTLHDVQTKRERSLDASSGWRKVAGHTSTNELTLSWNEPGDEGLGGISVTANAVADAAQHALQWRFRVFNQSTNWSVWRVIFPQLAVRDLGESAEVLFPRGPGEVQRGVWNRSFKYQSVYPNGWCAMQFMAVYRDTYHPTGLYLGVHDPWGSTKEIVLQSDPAYRSLRMSFDHPAPNMGRAGNPFELSGQAVWRLLRGDWFDAAHLYRSWVRKEAHWWPKLTVEGRSDTPGWMRQLNVWAQTGGEAPEVVPAVRQFQALFGQSPGGVGVHWYNWHQIPFDNDYPHYFPPKTNFLTGTKELEQSGVHVMPYINGRLWDTHDRGCEDYEFTRVARPAASKQEDGQPYLESYGSKETNGEPVRLAVMCPSTPLWQHKVSQTVLSLLQEVGASAVYIDQIAAAAPTLCMDPAHGHPLGGGHWWNEGYWAMLAGLRNAVPPGAALTTECNAEPFIQWLDGYLTWHWQYDGQVPAFPAVYGGTIQMFGRAYRGGSTKDLALRMKAGQQLVFGEQIGWIDPAIVKDTGSADFLRRVVAVRARFTDFFQAGEMARPPRLQGDVPKVRADWQWSGEWWVTTDAVLTGAWLLPQSRRLLLLFANVSDRVVNFKTVLDPVLAPRTAPSHWVQSNPEEALSTRTGSLDFAAMTLRPEQIQAIECLY